MTAEHQAELTTPAAEVIADEVLRYFAEGL